MTDLRWQSWLEPWDHNIGFSIRFSNFLVPILDQELSYGLHILPTSYTHVLYRLWWYKIQTMILSRRNVHFVIENSPKFQAKSLVIPFTNHYMYSTDSQNRHHLPSNGHNSELRRRLGNQGIGASEYYVRQLFRTSMDSRGILECLIRVARFLRIVPRGGECSVQVRPKKAPNPSI